MESLARKYLIGKLSEEFKRLWGVKNKKWLNCVVEDWLNDENNSASRYKTIKEVVDNNFKDKKILDMGSGCGTFVFYGLLNGYNVYGIDPEDWKHKFNKLKAREYGYPCEWMDRFIKGIGEKLPWPDNYFDIISTYQVLEHVQNVEKCINEMLRVLKPKGWIFIQCPDWSVSFFEGHYLLPMLPKMNRWLFKKYLKLIGRPTTGLDSLNYTTKRWLLKILKRYDCQIIDVWQYKFSRILVKKLGLANRKWTIKFLNYLYWAYYLLQILLQRSLILQVHLCVIKR